MAINISLYVHGVPKGQKIWGLDEQNKNFLELFYGRFKDLKNPTMLVETSGTNSYYTYIVSDNVFAKDGRAGSYIALTACVNTFYYADVVNMYNVLDAAYNKFIVGTITQYDGAATRFLIEDFDQVDNHLKQLSKELINYLLQFSSNADFVGLAGFQKQMKAAEFCNLSDCRMNDIAQLVKKTGGVFISPNLPSNAVKNATKKKDEEIAALKMEKQKAVQAIKDQYADADRTILKLTTDLATEQDRNNGLKKTVAERDQKIAMMEKQNKSSKELQNEVKECREIIDKHERALSEIGDIANKLSTLTGKSKQDNSKKTTIPIDKKSKGKRPLISLLFSFLNTVLLIVLLVLFFSKNNTMGDNPSTDTAVLYEQQIDSLKQVIKEKDKALEKVTATVEDVKPEQKSQIVKDVKSIGTYDHTYINAEPYDHSVGIKVGQSATLSIKKKRDAKEDLPPNDPNSMFKSNDENIVKITGNKLVAVGKGTCDIQYVVKGKSELTKSIKVIE